MGGAQTGKEAGVKLNSNGRSKPNRNGANMTKPYWIMQRINPQLGTYYVLHGQLSITAARKHEHAIYGTNIMHRFDSQADYLARIEQLRKEGAKIQ